MKVQYIEQTCKSLIHRIHKKSLPFHWCANPYRGCVHSCVYCYGRYTHKYLDLDPSNEFETTIFVKVNAPTILRKELSKPKWSRECVSIGSVCDVYQPIEEKYRLTREMLKAFLLYKSPVTFATKSDLVLRDVDILQELAAEKLLGLAISVSIIDNKMRKQLEPRAPSTERRLKAIQELVEAGIPVDVLMMPIVPFFNDSPEALEEMIWAIAEAGAKTVTVGIMYLTGSSKIRFFNFIEQEHPGLLENFERYYRNGLTPPKFYKTKIYDRVKYLKIKYNLAERSERVTQTTKNTQSTLDVFF